MAFYSYGLKLLVAGAMVTTPTFAAAQKCQGAGCVLPLQAPVAAPAPAPAPVASAPVEAVPVEAIAARRGIGIFALLLGAAAAAALLYFLLDDDNDDEEQPASP